jgi:flagellar motility protein MotE (MotC chaperone)
MAQLVPRFRFLGITIFFSALLLSVKIGSILEGVLGGAVSVSKVQAQQAPATAPVTLPGVAQAPSTAPVTLPGVQPTQQAQAQPPAAAPVQLPTPAPQAQAVPAPGQAQAAAPAPQGQAPGQERNVSRFITEDPTLLNQSEIDLLQQLTERRETLDAREREIERRIALLAAAEQRIDRKVNDLKNLQTTIETLLKQHKTEEDAKMASLVRLYENMKPKEAARIFEQLDMEILLKVVERMNERKLAPVMAGLNPEKAKQVTTELTRLRQLPKPGT